jgi:hypothetical protein
MKKLEPLDWEEIIQAEPRKNAMKSISENTVFPDSRSKMYIARLEQKQKVSL